MRHPLHAAYPSRRGGRRVRARDGGGRRAVPAGPGHGGGDGRLAPSCASSPGTAWGSTTWTWRPRPPAASSSPARPAPTRLAVAEHTMAMILALAKQLRPVGAASGRRRLAGRRAAGARRRRAAPRAWSGSARSARPSAGWPRRSAWRSRIACGRAAWRAAAAAAPVGRAVAALPLHASNPPPDRRRRPGRDAAGRVRDQHGPRRADRRGGAGWRRWRAGTSPAPRWTCSRASRRAPGHPLRSHPRVIATPHVAGTTPRSLVAMGVMAAECIAAVLTGAPVPAGRIVHPMTPSGVAPGPHGLAGLAGWRADLAPPGWARCPPPPCRRSTPCRCCWCASRACSR